MSLPGAPHDFDERIRDILTVWCNKIHDYASRDYYELVRFVYHERVNTFIGHLRERINWSPCVREIDNTELAARYTEIEQAWVKKPVRIGKEDKFKGTPAEAAANVLVKHRIRQDELEKIPV